MNITKTRAQLIREAAEKLNIVGTGQVLEAEYAQRFDDSIDPLLMQLASDGICEVVNDDKIPSEWFDALAGLLGNVCASLGGKNYDPNIKDHYQQVLMRVTASDPTYGVLENEYF